MNCQHCGKITTLNWGSSVNTLCKVCAQLDINDIGTTPKTKNYNKLKSEPLDPPSSLFSFGGRINRARFWIVIIPLLLASFLMQLYLINTGSEESLIFLIIFFVPVIWLSLATYVKRWHDLDQSGWFVITLLIPFLNLIIFLYLGFAPGTAGSNRYGSPS